MDGSVGVEVLRRSRKQMKLVRVEWLRGAFIWVGRLRGAGYSEKGE